MSLRTLNSAWQWLALSLVACACAAGSKPPLEHPPGVRNFGRAPGMQIGTGGTPSELDPTELPPDLQDNTDLAIPAPPATPAVLAVPCAGCVELNVYVNDINQRDEFGFAANGQRVKRVVWTLLVNFNSDQLAVQPFVDAKRGKYTNLHVNTFPLGKPVEVEQEYTGKAQTIGLVVGSSGAWTGNQVMSVFVDSVRIEGPRGSPELDKSFDTSAEGLAARTHEHAGQIVFHPAAPAAAPEPDAPRSGT